MKFLGIDINDALEFYSDSRLWLILSGVALILTCWLARHTRWIVPVWFFFIAVTGLHTAWLAVLAFAGLKDFAALAVMFMAVLSWPISITFLMLLSVRPRPRKDPGALKPPREL
jgi:hypothetical protein